MADKHIGWACLGRGQPPQSLLPLTYIHIHILAGQNNRLLL
jgi:hypothetical protein